MPTKSEVWELIDPVVRALGLELFELEMPNSRSSVLRVYVSRSSQRMEETAGSPEKARNVGIDDCMKVSKALSMLEGFDDLFQQEWTLEVSSPGINRRLTRPEHFIGAVGERVKVKAMNETPHSSTVVKGILRSFEGDQLTIDDEEKREAVTVPLQRVNEARVDFLFSKKG